MPVGTDKESHLQSIAARGFVLSAADQQGKHAGAGTGPRTARIRSGCLPPGGSLTTMRGTGRPAAGGGPARRRPLRTGPARPGREPTGCVARCLHALWAGGFLDVRARAGDGHGRGRRLPRPGRHGGGAGGRRALHRPHHPGGAGRPDRLRPAARHPARGAGRPRPPRAAVARRLRGQEPADRAGRRRQGAAVGDRRPRRRPGRRGRGSKRRRPRPRPREGGDQGMKEHLLSAADLDADDITRILDTAAHLAKVTDRAIKKVPTLRGRTVCNLFFEDSTRTRISFELAAKRLSADVINFTAKGSSVSKGESLKDTAITLEAMGVVAIVGDVLHSRVARSNVLALTTMGAEVTLVAPPTLLPARVDAWPVAVSYDLDAVLPKQDVVMMLRVQLERQQAGFFPSLREYARLYGLDAVRLAAMAPHAIVMHPGPMNRGVEIAAEVADSLERSVIANQVSNGISVRMAMLYLLLAGPPVPGDHDEQGARGSRSGAVAQDEPLGSGMDRALAEPAREVARDG